MAAVVIKPRKNPRSRPTRTALVESVLFVTSVGAPPSQGLALAHFVTPPLEVSTCPAVEPFVEIEAAVTFVTPLKLPINVPLKVTPVSVLVRTADGSCASGTVPVRLPAGTEVNEALGTGPFNCDPFRSVNPLPLPAKVEFVIKALVMLAPGARLEASVAVAAVAAVVALVAVAAVVALTAVVAVVAVAALPLMLMAAVPAPRFTGFNAVNPAPLPVKEPLKVTPVSVLVTTASGSCASGIEPVRLPAGTEVNDALGTGPYNCDALRFVSPAPLPANVEFVIKAPVMLAPETRFEASVAVAAVVAVVALVAVAALPLMLMAAVPALKSAGFNAVSPLPLPLNVPLKVTPGSVFVRMIHDNCVIGIVPVTCDAGSLPSRLLAVVAIIA